MLDIAKFNNNALNKNVDIIAGSMYRIGGLLHYMYGQIFANLKKNKVQALHKSWLIPQAMVFAIVRILHLVSFFGML